MRVLGYDCGFARSPFGQPISEAEYADFAKAIKPLLAGS